MKETRIRSGASRVAIVLLLSACAGCTRTRQNKELDQPKAILSGEAGFLKSQLQPVRVW